jgi:hypothetical protein
MLKLNVKITNKISPVLKKQANAIKKIPNEAYKVFVSETPVRSGNARRNTKQAKAGKEIQANYPYAKRLDEGYSKQSPEGMVKPTVDYVVNRFRQIMSGK